MLFKDAVRHAHPQHDAGTVQFASVCPAQFESLFTLDQGIGIQGPIVAFLRKFEVHFSQGHARLHARNHLFQAVQILGVRSADDTREREDQRQAKAPTAAFQNH